MAEELESCPECRYTLLERSTYCPHCGAQLTFTAWQKAAAWFVLILFIWGLARCNLEMFQRLEQMESHQEQSESAPGP
ncbi:MAG TPA: zinc-ribbon domain-containing protein [Acidobacteriota bacterium]|nr:zinc-ribbon domain-containing protein [Acidobacteriota bacterium]